MPRKRLTPADSFHLGSLPGPEGTTGRIRPRPPIADVAADASASASLRALSDSMAEARASGRMVTELRLSEIVLDHLVRDRIATRDDDLETLMASIRERGQQTPVEVMVLEDGRYGLISGWRRCQAIAQLSEEGGMGEAMVLALLRQPSDASDAYLAMVEENEIRVGLSHFERARIVLKTVEAGVFDTEKAALQTMFRAASRAKRSKIGSFLGVVRALDGHLRYPAGLGERLGLALSHRLEEDAKFAALLRDQLRKAESADFKTEQDILQKALTSGPEHEKKSAKTSRAMVQTKVREGLILRRAPAGGKIEISGSRVDESFHARLCAWLNEEG